MKEIEKMRAHANRLKNLGRVVKRHINEGEDDSGELTSLHEAISYAYAIIAKKHNTIVKENDALDRIAKLPDDQLPEIEWPRR